MFLQEFNQFLIFFAGDTYQLKVVSEIYFYVSVTRVSLHNLGALVRLKIV